MTRGHPPGSYFKFIDRILHLHSSLLDVVFDTIKKCALIDDKD